MKEIKIVISIPEGVYLDLISARKVTLTYGWLADVLKNGVRLEDIKTEIKGLNNLPLIRAVSASAAVDTCLEIIDKCTSEEGGKE